MLSFVGRLSSSWRFKIVLWEWCPCVLYEMPFLSQRVLYQRDHYHVVIEGWDVGSREHQLDDQI